MLLVSFRWIFWGYELSEVPAGGDALVAVLEFDECGVESAAGDDTAGLVVAGG